MTAVGDHCHLFSEQQWKLNFAYSISVATCKKETAFSCKYIFFYVCVLFLTALFAAVEHGHLDKARTILESTDVDVNR